MAELASKKWAKALLELVNENNELSADSVLKDLRNVEETFESSTELSNMINNPAISTEEKQIVICKLFQNKIEPIVYNFLFVLNLKKRLGLISEIIKEVELGIDKLNNVLRVEVTSAIDISEDKRNEIKGKLSYKLNKDIRINWGVDADIIAGLIFNINDTVVDNSVKHKLNKLSENIIKV